MNCPRCHSALVPGAAACPTCGFELAGLAHAQPLSQPLATAWPPSVPFAPGNIIAPEMTGFSPPSYAQPAPGASKLPAPLVRLFGSRWGVATALGLVIGLIAVVEAFLIPVDLRDQDWVAGSRVAAFAAFGVGALGLQVVIVRTAMRRWRGMSFAANLVMVVLLAFVGTGGLVANRPIRELQARHDVAIGDWSNAVQQLVLVLADPSCGRDCQHANLSDEAYARYEYGLQLAGQHDYHNAIAQFNGSLTASPKGSYAQASRENLAEAQYQYGLQLLSQQNYLQAITQLLAVQDDLPESPYVSKAHSAVASAYLSLAEQELSGPACLHAVSLLQVITGLYADTPEAAEAKAKLATPATVSGVIENATTDGALEVFLSKSGHAPQYNQSSGSFGFSEDYHTRLNPHDESYEFSHVAAGTYTISTYDEITEESSWWYNYDYNGLYFLQVGPACPYVWTTLDCSDQCR